MSAQQATAAPTQEMTELLSQMHSIIAPSPVTTWPVALGWWVILIFTLVAIPSIIYFIYHKYQSNAYRREALSIITQLEPAADTNYATRVSTLLKRVAFSAYPSSKPLITQAHGEKWVEWLNQSTQQPLFNQDSTNALALAPYKPNIPFDEKALKAAAQKWIKNHKKNTTTKEVKRV